MRYCYLCEVGWVALRAKYQTINLYTFTLTFCFQMELSLGLTRFLSCWVITSCCRRMRTTTGKHVTCLTVLTFILILLPLWARLQSRIFDSLPEDIQEAKELNAQRLKKAEKFLAQTSPSDILELLEWAKGGQEENIDLAIGIITNVREKDDSGILYNPKYLTQVLTELLKVMNSTAVLPMTTMLLLCNVQQNPEQHREAKAFSNFLTEITHSEQHSEVILDTFEVEKRDYVFCLKKISHLYRSRYVLLLEDDAVPNGDFWQVLKFVTSHLEDAHEGGTKAKEVAYVKLYHPEHLLDYLRFDWDRACELLEISLTSGTLLVLPYAWILSRYTRFPDLNCCVLWLAVVLCIITMLLAVGRKPVLKLRSYLGPRFYWLIKAPSCCTQAVLFPAHNTQTFIDYLSDISCTSRYAKDSAMESFVRASSLQSYQALPNAFTHIGLVSSFRKGYVNPKSLS